MNQEFVWWKHGVFYQIYPRSFMDSNGDGDGDLQGIIDRLDYISELGVDAIWISPIYASPLMDNGYDVSDYTDIHPMFGDMETFDRFLTAVHKRNLRLVMDYVPNHTSDQHPWFIESRSSRDNVKRDWYIWKDAKPDGSPPNNWESIFGGPGWRWDEVTNQYYLHTFLKEQPDLNWRNPEVIEAMQDVLRFWLDRGVDGFRMDTIMSCIKHPDFPDNPPIEENSPYEPFGRKLEPLYSMRQPGVHEISRGFRKILDSYNGERVMIGETWIFIFKELVTYYGENLDEFHIPFNFMGTTIAWNAVKIKDAISAYYAVMPKGATPNFVFGSHDVHRLATRFGLENHRSAAMLLLTLWGIPIIYYADELGMEDVNIPPKLWQDQWGKNLPDLNVGRDPERTPMQWDDSPNAGFSPAGVKTWLPIAENYQELNVLKQQRNKASTLNFYKSLLKLRREIKALHAGTLYFIEEVPVEIMAYVRSVEKQRVLVVINFVGKRYRLNLSSLKSSGRVLLSSHSVKSDKVDLSDLVLNPHESLLIYLI